MTCQLICVPPNVVDQVWPKISGLIYVAMKKGQVGSFESIQNAILTGRVLVWVAWDGESPNIEATAVTELQSTEWRKVCCVLACAGAHMERWIHLLETIEEYAKSEGCSAVRVIGRHGWQKMLPSYKVKRILMEKLL